MVIKPGEAQKAVEDRISPQVDALEKRIDETIRSKFNGRSVTYHVPAHTDSLAVKAVMEKYASAGWNVKEEFGDQRDPYHWIVLSIKKTSPCRGPSRIGDVDNWRY